MTLREREERQEKKRYKTRIQEERNAEKEIREYTREYKNGGTSEDREWDGLRSEEGNQMRPM